MSHVLQCTQLDALICSVFVPSPASTISYTWAGQKRVHGLPYSARHRVRQMSVSGTITDALDDHLQGGVTVADAGLMVEAAKSYDAAKNMMGMSGKVTRVPVSGVGDDAYYLVGGRDAPLFAKKGDTAVRIAVGGKGWSVEEIKSKEKALALALLAKL